MADQSPAAQARRPYHSPTRQRQAEEARRRILDAARLLFREAGYVGTTLNAIAAAAGVSPKTVEATFGSKRGLLAALVDPVASGRRFQELLGDLRAATDPRRRVELAARLTRQVYEAWGLRRQNQTRLIAYLSDQGVLRGGLAPQEATDVLWALTGYDLYRALVVECGWAPQRYEAWLADMLIQHLLAPR
jgi:AcrR family transcriptional regulator